MSTLKVNALNNDGSAIDFPNSFTLGGNPIEQGYTSSATEPSSPSTGDLWWDSANEKLYQYLNGEFKELNLSATVVNYGNTAVINVVTNSNNSHNTINIDTTSNGSYWGYTIGTGIINQRAACTNGTYGVWGGGYTTSLQNAMDRITFSSAANSVDFGDLTVARNDIASAASLDRGFFVGGYDSLRTIDYITISASSNATDFGDTSQNVRSGAAVGDVTYIVYDKNYSNNNVLDYITAQTLGNGTQFGSIYSGYNKGAAADDTRGLFVGNQSSSNNIHYITIATQGNSTDFGDLSLGRNGPRGVSNGTRAVFCGAYSSTLSTYNRMDYVTIQTTGNAADFGDLQNVTSNRKYSATSGT